MHLGFLAPLAPPIPLSGFLLLSLNPLRSPLPKAADPSGIQHPNTHTKARINSWLCLGTDVQQLGSGGDIFPATRVNLAGSTFWGGGTATCLPLGSSLS